MGHYGSSNIDTFTSTYKEYKETLIDVIDDLASHSYITKLKIISSWYRAKSKANTRVKNNACYIPWFYTTWDQIVTSNMIHCVLVLMTTTTKFKQCLLIILKPHIKKTNLLLSHLWRTVQKLQKLYRFVFHK